MKKGVAEVARGHQTISASAGSGKTYQLALRYIGLLAGGAAPERIVALTFTRKAAGEIFDRVMRRLAEALGDEGERAKLNGELGTQLSAAELAGHMRAVIHAMPLLRIGTLDSFMAQVTQAFSLELGLQGGFEILEGAALSLAVREALKQALAPSGPDGGADDFIQAFKESTFGHESKSVCGKLEQFIGDYHHVYLELPEERRWGSAELIWREPPFWATGPELSGEGVREVLAELEGAIEGKDWQGFIEKLGTFDGGRFAGGSVLLEQFIRQASRLGNSETQLICRKKALPLTPEVREKLSVLAAWYFREALGRQIRRTGGIYRVLRHYDAVYHERVRRAGRITFQDLIHVLNGSALASGGTIRLTQENDGRADDRLYIDYRLDGRFDHWMLDEFQDTSQAQWNALSNLIDEIMQHRDGSRTFFYVGDVKQAIYGWRGGDSLLFSQVLERYQGRIEERYLAKSWRSAPAVIDTVNRVFQDVPSHERLPEEAAMRWNAAWQRHETEQSELPGYCALYELDRQGRESEFNDVEMRYDFTAALVKELRGKPGADVAVLVRGNATGVALANHLRVQGLDAVWEGDAEINDNTVVAALLALLKLAAHPGDELAWRHIGMSPLAELVRERGFSRQALSSNLLRQLHEEGFHRVLREWMKPFEKDFSGFTDGRARQLLHEALAFDGTGDRNADHFIELVNEAVNRGAPSAGAVRVMTLHKAKGLEFDAVILPDLQSQSLDSFGPGGLGLVSRMRRENGSAKAEWTLLYPAREFAEADAALRPPLESNRIEGVYEALCLLYVGMTRARQGLYLVATAASQKSDAYYPADLLREKLSDDAGERVDIHGCSATRLYECGRPDWQKKVRREASRREPEPAQTGLARPLEKSPIHAQLERQIPSEEAEEQVEAAQLFAPAGREAAEFGTAIHALFEQVAWSGEGSLEEWIAAWRSRFPLSPALAERVETEFRAAMSRAEVVEALARPGANALVWRERRFEIARGNRWISGCFDRVAVALDSSGKPESAVILDYKSNRISQASDLHHAVEMYRPQLVLYRDVLAGLLGLAPGRIRLQLLFTHPGRVEELRGDCKLKI